MVREWCEKSQLFTHCKGKNDKIEQILGNLLRINMLTEKQWIRTVSERVRKVYKRVRMVSERVRKVLERETFFKTKKGAKICASGSFKMMLL